MIRLILLVLFIILTFNSKAQELDKEQFMNAWVVIVDTSNNYFDIRAKMFFLHNTLDIDVDTMNRGYDKERKIICLPVDDEDEIYAGEYYPRRYPGESLSIEHLNYYLDKGNISKNTLALVVAIETDKNKAENTQKKVMKHFKNAFMIHSRIYIGCMH